MFSPKLPIREFKVEKAIYDELSRSEKKAIPILEEVCKQVAIIYAKQEDGLKKSFGAAFYPSDVSDSEIESASQKNPEIFSPYTIVEKTANDFKAIPYHVKYKDELQKISELLKKAKQLIKDKKLALYLQVLSESILTGDYKSMDKAWLETGDSRLQFILGPYERYLDRRFFKKMAFLAFVGIKDSFYSQKADQINKILLTNIGEQNHRFTRTSKISVSAIRNLIFSGFNAQSLLSTEHLPSDDSTINEYGSRILEFLSSMDYKFDKLLYPIFKTIFETTFRKTYTEDALRQGNYLLMMVYSLARQLHRYKGSRERLKELYPVYDEANSITSGIQHSKHLVLKGVIDQKDLEAMIIMHICWCFSEWVFAKNSAIRTDYLRADALALSFYFQNQALKESGGISWPNFSKIFFVIENLSTIFVKTLSSTSYEEANTFLKNNLSYEIFKAFDKKLTKIKFPK